MKGSEFIEIYVTKHQVAGIKLDKSDSHPIDNSELE